MPRNCCVPLCGTNSRKDPHIRYHEFPCDAKRREAWLRNISREGAGGKGTKWQPTDRSLVCALHFTEQDYKVANKNRVLLQTAVPTVFPGYPSYMRKRALLRAALARTERSRPERTENAMKARGDVASPDKRIAVQDDKVLDRREDSEPVVEKREVSSPSENEPIRTSSEYETTAEGSKETTRRLRAKIARLNRELQTLQRKLDEAEERARVYESNKDIDCFMRLIDAAAHGDETAGSIVNQVYSFHGEAEFGIFPCPSKG
ncbi:THAP domain-containing protein 11-like [Dermacentor albipictus]|uniref:THAP domain-containing protein 11-like n=1 Tax=Dermacentor albipictus TaxID=60249 RepID=UPI0038FBFEB6